MLPVRKPEIFGLWMSFCDILIYCVKIVDFDADEDLDKKMYTEYFLNHAFLCGQNLL